MLAASLFATTLLIGFATCPPPNLVGALDRKSVATTKANRPELSRSHSVSYRTLWASLSGVLRTLSRRARVLTMDWTRAETRSVVVLLLIPFAVSLASWIFEFALFSNAKSVDREGGYYLAAFVGALPIYVLGLDLS